MISLSDLYDLETLIKRSQYIKTKPLTLSELIEILQVLKCSAKSIYEVLFVCSQPKYLIFKSL